MTEKLSPPSWSASQYSVFSECLRKYFYGKYWTCLPKEIKWTAYEMKHLSGVPLLKGDCLHRVIKKSIDYYRLYSAMPSLEKLVVSYRKMLREGYNESFKFYSDRDYRWGKKINDIILLSEHFYGDESVGDNVRKAEETGIEALKSLYESDIWKQIFITPIKDIYAVDPGNFPSFQWEWDNAPLKYEKYRSIKIFSVIDLAMRYEGKLHIIDWKSGKEDSGNPLQLAVYTLFANDKWNFELKDIDLSFCYLGQETSVKPVSITVGLIKSAIDRIESSYAKMAELYNEGEPDIERFSMCKDENICRFCNFRKLCGR